MRKYLLYTISAVLLLTGCTYSFDAELDTSEDILVFEGDIVVGGTTNISVSRVANFGESHFSGWSSSSWDYSSSSISYDPFYEDAVIECEDGTVVTGTLSKDRKSAVFNTEGLSMDKAYRVRLNVWGKEYVSSWSRADGGAPVIDALKYEIRDGDAASSSYFGESQVRFMISAHSDISPYFRFQLIENYEVRSPASTWLLYIPPVESEDAGEDYGQIIETDHYTYPVTCYSNPVDPYTTTISAIAYEGSKLTDYPFLAIGKTSLKISRLYHLTVQASTLSKKAYEYWQNLDKVSYPSGDLFTPTPSSMRGNIARSDAEDVTVMGYVGVTSVAVKDIWFDNTKENFYKTSDEILAQLRRVDQLEGLATDSHNWPSMYYGGNVPYQPVMSENGMFVDHYSWIPRRCVDCTYNTEYVTEKPEGWPN